MNRCVFGEMHGWYATRRRGQPLLTATLLLLLPCFIHGALPSLGAGPSSLVAGGALLSTVGLLPGLVRAAGGKPRSAAYWDKLLADEDRLKGVEDEWAADDEEEELLTEGQLEYQNMERRKAQPASPKDFGVDDPSEWMTHQESTAGPTMMFAKLNHTKPDGSKLTREDTQELAAMWKELLFTGGVECTPYDIEWDTILMTLQRGWNGFQMKDFLLSRNEVLKVTWNSKDYLKEGVTEQDLSGDAGDEGRSKKGKKKKTKKKKKKKKRQKKKKEKGSKKGKKKKKKKKKKSKSDL